MFVHLALIPVSKGIADSDESVIPARVSSPGVNIPPGVPLRELTFKVSQTETAKISAKRCKCCIT